MSRVLDSLARADFRVAAASDFDVRHPKSELRRLTDAGALVRVARGFYALVPEGQRGVGTSWRPSLEGAALGVAVAMFEIGSVALVGPSAARAHGCYPRALGGAFVAVPRQRARRETPYGPIHFSMRDTKKLDTVRISTDLGDGWATSPEQTAFDLVRNWPVWPISESTCTEMLNLLAARIDWSLVDEVAARTRSVDTLHELRTRLGDRVR